MNIIYLNHRLINEEKSGDRNCEHFLGSSENKDWETFKPVGHGFNSRTELNFFQSLFSLLLK